MLPISKNGALPFFQRLKPKLLDLKAWFQGRWQASTRFERQLAAILAGLLALYLWTAPPSVTLEDSGLFLTEAYHLGLAHPPGYPLFVLVGKLFSFLPWGEPAQRITFFCHLLGVGGCWLTALILKRWTGSEAAALLAAMGLGLTEIYWYQSLVAEVYLLSGFFFALTTWLILRWQEKPTQGRLRVLAFLGGLAFTTHPYLMVLTFPALLIWLGKDTFRLLARLQNWLGWFALGLLPFLHLVLVTHYSRFIFFAPIENWAQFVDYLLRREYAGSDVNPWATWKDVAKYLMTFGKMLLKAFSPLGVMVIALGFEEWRKPAQRWRLLGLLWGLLSTSVLMQVFRRAEYTWHDLQNYLTWQIVPLICAAWIFGLSLAGLERRWPQYRQWGLRLGVASLLLWGTFFTLPLNRLDQDTLAYDYARVLLDYLPPNAVLIVHDDTDTSPLVYVRHVLNVRPDVTVVSQVAALFPDRMFDRYTNDDDRREATLGFIKYHLSQGRRVFSSDSLRYFKGEHKFPLPMQHYGLYREITLEEKPETPDPRWTQAMKRVLDRAMANPLPNQWQSFRHTVYERLCHGVLVGEQDHPMMQAFWGCRMIKAQWLNVEEQRYEEADKLFLSILPHLETQAVIPRTDMLRQFLVNRANWINNRPELEPEAKLALIQEAVDKVFFSVHENRDCENPLAFNLVQLHQQMPLKIDMETLYKIFGTCSKFKGMWSDVK